MVSGHGGLVELKANKNNVHDTDDHVTLWNLSSTTTTPNAIYTSTMISLYTLSFVFFVILTGLAVVASGFSIVVQARLPKVRNRLDEAGRED